MDSNPKLRKVILENMELSTVKAIAEIAKNTLNGATQILDTKFHKQLKKYKKVLRVLASRNIKLSVKRDVLISSHHLIRFLLESIFSGVIGELIEKTSV